MKKIALFGNPNTGKSSLFNRLTGLKQHIGNFPGVTVEKSSGPIKVNDETWTVTDFPGTYSVYPRSLDERVVYDVISNPQHKEFPDLIVVVVDATNLERNLLLFSQLYDLGLPTIMALNMTDVAAKRQITIDLEKIQEAYKRAKIVRINARIGTGIPALIDAFSTISLNPTEIKTESLQAIDDTSAQATDTNSRYQAIRTLIQDAVQVKDIDRAKRSKADRILTHPILGYLIFFLLLLFIFQSVFTLAAYPMDWIDGTFADLSARLSETLPPGLFTRLLSEGIVPGIGGVLVFVPQIALLFFSLSILEETGYMARVVFLMDRLMRPFGLNGKSVVPLISSAACAIPGIMAARTIASHKERLTTILVAPLISCSARIPVYTLLISLVIPNTRVLGFFSLQGLVLFGLYVLGIVGALAVAWVLKKILKTKELSVFLLELPSYKNPRWGNVGLEVLNKVKIFVTDAGKIIVAISILLWALASFGPGNEMEVAAKQVSKKNISLDRYQEEVAAAKLEHSYMGYLGKGIEPVIRPLGYDWKIGISLLTSFAAREVFVGSLATIYSVHQEDDDPTPLIERLKKEKRADGTPTYSLASGLSLLVFYVFAMQCMATLAVVKRETKSWKWPLIQTAYMGVMAYLGALIVFNLFS
jgi:ferrous iron transport protein B